MMYKKLFPVILSSLLVSAQAFAEESTGQVKIPLVEYTALVDQANQGREQRQSRTGYAMGHADVQAVIVQNQGRAACEATVTLDITVLESKWHSVPILPPGTAVSSVTVGGNPVQLVPTQEGLAWEIKDAGDYQMKLLYSIDARASENGYSLPLPIPETAATHFSATLPGAGLDVGVLPASGLKTSVSEGKTIISALIPSSKSIYLSWRTPLKQGYSISRATYTGLLDGEAVSWKGVFSVALFSDELAKLKLFPSSVTLSNVQVDGKDTPIVLEDGQFATLIKGSGTHEVIVDFQVPVTKSDGPPQVDFAIPEIPVSKFILKIAGKKEISASPASNVTMKSEGSNTIATLNVPMTDHLTLSWKEAVPEEIKTEFRANASLYHAIHAEEGVLSMHAIVEYEITRGETSELQLQIPPDVQINRIISSLATVADWRIVVGAAGEPSVVHVFLDRKVKDPLTLDISYDRSLIGEGKKDNIEIPLLRALGMNRQRGMAALLSSKELTLKPVSEENVTPVGENQLPAEFRAQIELTVAHTYKYVGNNAKLVAQATTPERTQGKFDGQVDTLISLSDVTLKGSASVQVNVKSGTIADLQLKLPSKVNLLSLTAPSLRTYKVNPGDSGQEIDVQFTQDMEGVFRIDATYEYIMGEGDAEVIVPTLSVKGVEVEQGRIGVEALSAVEVRTGATEQLSSLEPSELPKQLILKTTNPILLAYKYVQNEPPYKLGLQITRHREIDVQSAMIDQATYQTLFTEDGFAVTNAQFMVRNSKRQFLRVTLPPKSEPWSVFVDGRPEKPAEAGGKDDLSSSILIKIINSAHGFPVNIIYRTPVAKVGTFGIIAGTLPKPDLVVTNSQWDVYLPDEVHYGRPDTNMKIKSEGVRLSGDAMKREFLQGQVNQEAIEPLRLSIPTTGVRYSFEKLYANQSDEQASFSLPYLAGVGTFISYFLMCGGTLMFWWGVINAIRAKEKSARKTAALYICGSAAMLIVTIGYLAVNFLPTLLFSILAAGTLGAKYAKRYIRKFHRASNAAE